MSRPEIPGKVVNERRHDVNFLHKITAKPWEHAGDTTGVHGGYVPGNAARSTGLKLFLLVVSSLFFLFIVAYNMRMELADWRPLAEPRILWFNTLLLVLGSGALHMARIAANRGDTDRLRRRLVTGGVLTIAFLAGQLMAWQQLRIAGLYATVNPSYAFFYLLTGLHGAHLAGGLWAWGRLTGKLREGVDIADLRTSVGMCSLYWHYLLLVWLLMFGLLLST
jgi:cytochrome c oxidase subunit 3